MSKVKFGYGNTALCKLIFGGSATWWSFGYPWILEYLDKRYNRTISHEKLRAINKFVQKTSLHHFHYGTAVECQGLSFLPWSIFGFIDFSINRISRPMLGSDGDYDSAPLRPLGDVVQRLVYTGYKKCYGLILSWVCRTSCWPILGPQCCVGMTCWWHVLNVNLTFGDIAPFWAPIMLCCFHQLPTCPHVLM